MRFCVSTNPICIPKSSARRAAYNGAIVSSVALIFVLPEALLRPLYATECTNLRQTGLDRLLSAPGIHRRRAPALSAHNPADPPGVTPAAVSAPPCGPLACVKQCRNSDLKQWGTQDFNAEFGGNHCQQALLRGTRCSRISRATAVVPLRIKILTADSESPCQTTWIPLFTFSSHRFTVPQSAPDSVADTDDVA